LLEEEDVLDPLGKFARDGATDYAAADDDDVNSIHEEDARAT
jgi:hypothetical protein